MKKVKSSGTVKKMAEMSDIGCWPVSTEGLAFQPGTRYNLGVRTQAFAYTLENAAAGAEWSFCFDTEGAAPEITHPAGVKIGDFEIDSNQHVEVDIMQLGSYKYLIAHTWDRSE